MSRTYRRLQVELTVTKENLAWSIPGEEPRYLIAAGHGRDWENSLGFTCPTSLLDTVQTQRKVAWFYTDSGTRKSYQYLKKLLNGRYRRLAKAQLRASLASENRELQLYQFKKFDFGYWFD